VRDDGPVSYYLYNRTAKAAKFLFTNRKSLEGQPLVKMIPLQIKSEDGLDLVSYLSLPKWSDPDGNGRPDKPLPMVLYVHGGPWERETWGYKSIHQWLANRGYAVLSVNYRGSTSFGKNFTNAGNLEWGGKMQRDLVDAVNWSIREGVADKDRIAIMGGSYGGYAALAGLTFTPDLFACAVDIVGPSNLITMTETIPPYWIPEFELWSKRVGDNRTEEGRALLRERSPLTHVDRIKKPLLIAQGANDPRVKRNESDQIVNTMNKKGINVTYILYPDEGHGFARPENSISFFAVAEAFLSKHLGGRFEPIGNDFNGSTITVLSGADQVPGLQDAIRRTEGK
jgi:dipeptidyl aminopeptidase/acylaminoacyl peptidase